MHCNGGQQRPSTGTRARGLCPVCVALIIFPIQTPFFNTAILRTFKYKHGQNSWSLRSPCNGKVAPTQAMCPLKTWTGFPQGKTGLNSKNAHLGVELRHASQLH